MPNIIINLTYTMLYMSNWGAKNLKVQLHAVSRTQQGKQREPSVQTLQSLPSRFTGTLCAPTPRLVSIHLDEY